MHRTLPLALLLLASAPMHAQLLSDQEARDQMKYDVQYLASDLLEGREAGTKGERMAGDYIVQKMASIGLMPYGDSATYRQAFTFAAQPRLGDKQVFQLGRERLAINEQYHPLSFSGTGAVLATVARCGYGIHAPELDRNDFADIDLKGKCAAIAVGSPDGIHPHSKFLAYHDLQARAAKAVELGATCVLFYNDDKAVDPTQEGRELLLSEKTMAQHLKPAGYTTGIVGKWHLGDTAPEFMPLARGFDFELGTVGNLGEGKGPSFYRGSELIKELEGAPVTSPVDAKEGCGFIDANKEKPFFLYLSFNAVHSPIVASPHWLEKFKHLDKRQQGYAALIGEADEAIGTVMTKLRDLKLEENTLLFVISDNGGASKEAEQMGLRGSKWFVWEGGIRGTWMAQWKGTIPGNRVVNDPEIQLDVLPTALAAAESRTGFQPVQDELKTRPTLDGVNLLPLLKSETDKLAPRELYFRFGVQHAVRQGDWKLVKASKDMEPMLVNLARSRRATRPQHRESGEESRARCPFRQMERQHAAAALGGSALER